MTIKQIFSDMDWTILNPQGKVSDESAERIRTCGIPLTLVSARAPMEMADAIAKLGLTGPQIAFNGGLIFKKAEVPGWKVLEDSPLDFAVAKQIMTYIQTEFPSLTLSYYDLDNWYIESWDKNIDYEIDITDCKPTLINFQEALSTPSKIYKIMVITETNDENNQLEAGLRALNLPDVSYSQSNYNYLEITSEKAKKSRGIRYIFAEEKLKKAETAAFGDGPNDLPMFALVGLPIAMENASAEVKVAAKYVTKSNAEDGVAYGIEKYC